MALSTYHLILLLSPIAHLIQPNFKPMFLTVMTFDLHKIVFERFVSQLVLVLGCVRLPKFSHELLKLFFIILLTFLRLP